MHLSLNFRTARFILRSEPDLISYLYAIYTQGEAFADFFELYRQVRDPALLLKADTLRRKHSYRKEHLEAALRSDVRQWRAICTRFPDWLQEQHADFPEFWQANSAEPLASCSLEQLLALDYDLDATLHSLLDDFEVTLRWLNSGEPLSHHPKLENEPKEQQPLDFYQRTPNGLYEIFEHCQLADPQVTALFAHQRLDAFMEAAIAWLRAEADGVEVESLSSLVPKYLEQVPRDPCDGKPLRCLPDQRALYSVGTDLKDAEGISGEPPHQYSLSSIEPAYFLPKIEGSARARE